MIGLAFLQIKLKQCTILHFHYEYGSLLSIHCLIMIEDGLNSVVQF